MTRIQVLMHFILRRHTGKVGIALFLITSLITGCAAEDPQAANDTTDEAPRHVLLNIGVLYEASTTQSQRESFSIEVPGDEIWQPDTEYATERQFGEYPVGSEERFYIYPEGVDGTRYEVPFTMQPTMYSGMAHSKLYVEINDDSITVRGKAIPDGRISFAQ